ncbi:MAG TPA: hypothetical protein VEW68_01575 [Patescibacteria group bacterium]|nr:hypothetical protein [Patescibacteria group bacterium]
MAPTRRLVHEPTAAPLTSLWLDEDESQAGNAQRVAQHSNKLTRWQVGKGEAREHQILTVVRETG